ncbi:MAG TPA: LytTR family DNA-binding domain-containing protein [Candidatus Baltobacteraceae bacterium]|jgi:two-component system LytT family response regulator|nr:LytTR family DNA-binding domain-containing protein [Candidatus Baltobacteraceae bacterium]
MKIRTLIVDDEPLARARLRQLLMGEPEIEIAGECSNGLEAVAAIRSLCPRLVFLDVQMPELDGFGVLESIGEGAMPVIVFVSAHDEFALRAFEVHAADYLLKPFNRERFQTALRHALERARRHDDRSLQERQSALLRELASAKSPERLIVKSGGRITWVRPEEIFWIQSANNYVELHLEKKSHLLRETLNTIEARLAPGEFIRISRSVIVNRQRVSELQRLFYGGYAVILQNGLKLTLSRRYRDKLKQLGLG